MGEGDGIMTTGYTASLTCLYRSKKSQASKVAAARSQADLCGGVEVGSRGTIRPPARRRARSQSNMASSEKAGFKALQSGGRPDADKIIEIETIQRCNPKSAAET